MQINAAGTIVSNISDHKATFIPYHNSIKKVTGIAPNTFQDISDGNLKAVRDAVEGADWTPVFSSHCINKAYNEFISTFATLHNVNFPFQSIYTSKK